MRLLNKTEAAEIARSTPSTLDRLRRAGGGPAFVLIGGRVWYQDGDVDDYIKSRRVEPTAQKTQA